MRRPVLAIAAVVAGVLVVPTAVAATGSAAEPADTSGTVRYSDPALAGRATVTVRGTLLPIHSEAAGADESYAVELAGGQLVPVSLHLRTPVEEPRAFTGDLAVDSTLTRRLGARGLTVAAGRRIAGDSASGRQLLTVASRSTRAMPVRSADLAAASTAAATPSAHQLYVAVITNRGVLDPSTTIANQVTAMRNFWSTEGDGMITSFDQVGASQFYASDIAPSTTDGCGLGSPTSVWNEAAAKFPGVSFGSNGAHLMVLVSEDCSGSNGAGIGTVGGSLRYGGRSIVSLGDGGVQIGVHELGHNFSLQHANAQQCSSSGCSTQGYMDVYSIMGLAVTGGGWTPPALDTSYRVLDGIATSSEVPTVTTTGSVHLNPRAASTGTRGFLVTDPSTKAKFTVEYRSGTGRDASAFYATSRSLSPFSYRPGVVVERMESDGSSTLMTRQSGTKYLTSYVPGESFTVGSLTLTVASATPSAGAEVNVDIAGTTPTSAPPSSTTPAAPSTTPTGSPTTPTTPPTSGPSTPPTGSPAPSNFQAGMPVVVGSARVGARLAAWPGRWSPNPSRFEFQWLANGRPIGNATSSSFVPSSALRGNRISVRVTASRSGYATTSRTSASTRPVDFGRFRTHTPSIAGTRAVGHTVSVRTGSWSPSPRFTYRWYASGRPIANATGSRLHITRSLRGKAISVRVVASRGGYTPAARTAPRTSRVR